MNSSVPEEGQFRSVEARDFGLGVPIVFTVGWLVLAYFMISFLVNYISPAIFGTRRPIGGPFYSEYYWPYGRTTRHKRTALATMGDVMTLTSRIVKAIENKQ